eukprot:3219227-Amphidinium_carterae.1
MLQALRLTAKLLVISNLRSQATLHSFEFQNLDLSVKDAGYAGILKGWLWGLELVVSCLVLFCALCLLATWHTV